MRKRPVLIRMIVLRLRGLGVLQTGERVRGPARRAIRLDDLAVTVGRLVVLSLSSYSTRGCSRQPRSAPTSAQRSISEWLIRRAGQIVHVASDMRAVWPDLGALNNLGVLYEDNDKYDKGGRLLQQDHQRTRPTSRPANAPPVFEGRPSLANAILSSG